MLILKFFATEPNSVPYCYLEFLLPRSKNYSGENNFLKNLIKKYS